jgi:glycosyltransferase involved in cell wall biosynthesis
VGDGKERPKLEAQMYVLGLEALVKFLGRVQPDKTKAILSSCALVAIPRKPYAVCKIVPPLKLVEALALGKAVVVPNLQVFRDELGQDAPAFFFESGDAKDLARVIDEALADMPAIRTLGERARQYAVNHRNWRRFVSLFAQ